MALCWVAIPDHATRGMPVGPRTSLRLVRAAPTPQGNPVVALGIDDWSHEGHVFGTILVDLEAHKIIDLLPDRTADGVAAWLARQSTIEFVTRDRAGAAPLAVQVADRFHVLKKLTDVVEHILSRHQPVLHAAARSALEQQAALYEQDRSNDDQVARPASLDRLIWEPPFPLVADARLAPSGTSGGRLVIAAGGLPVNNPGFPDDVYALQCRR